jgi:excisionase family DNA binding protein
LSFTISMAESRMTVITAKEAARYLRVSMLTLSRIEREGGLVPYRTPGGHRSYKLLRHIRLRNDLRMWPFQRATVQEKEATT